MNHFITKRILKNIEKKVIRLMIIILKYFPEIGIKATSLIDGIVFVSICELENI